CSSRTLWSITMAAVWSGLVHLKHNQREYQPLYLPRHPNRLPPRKSHRPRLHLYQPSIVYRKPNVANSPSCSATWSIRPSCPRSSTPKTTEKWYVNTKKSVLRSSPALMDTLRNYSGMDFSSTLAIPTPMKMMPKEPSVLGWEFLLPWEIPILV